MQDNGGLEFFIFFSLSCTKLTFFIILQEGLQLEFSHLSGMQIWPFVATLLLCSLH